MSSKSERRYKYGEKPAILYTVDAVKALGGEATAAQVERHLKDTLDNYKDDTSSNLRALSVNCVSRAHWSFNKTQRRSDDETHKHHKYDQLFKRGSIYEIYRPAIHGVYELSENEQGVWGVQLVKSDFEKSVDIASKLSREQRKEYLEKASRTPEIIEVTTRAFKRNQYVVAETLSRANGQCQHCQQEAPFKRLDGTPYLEVHHIEWLSRGGEDTVENSIALCPNCHRQAHFGVLELSKANASRGK